MGFIKKYSFELISAVVILIIFIILLPKNHVDVPNIEDIQLSGLDVTFVTDNTGSLVPSSGEIISPDVSTGMDTNTGTTPVAVNNTGALSVDQIVGLPVIPVYTGKSTSLVAVIATEPKSCTAPWGQTIEHGKSVLAYQQRTDDNSICNVQRRLCNDGKLAGTYTQRSCKELYQGTAFTTSRRDTNNNYINVSSSDTSSSSPDQNLIQPTPPSGSDRNFNTNGQLDGSVTPQTTWTNGVHSPVSSTPGQEQVVKQTPSQCISPWNTLVNHGQFVKAYRYNNGFSNMACEVELRYCVNGTLEGSFNFSECIPNDIAVEDFLNNYFDPEVPSLMQLVETLYSNINNPHFQQDYPDVQQNLLLHILQGLL